MFTFIFLRPEHLSDYAEHISFGSLDCEYSANGTFYCDPALES